MSEHILKAIIQLLAIVAREDDVTLDEKASIENFLLDNLSKEDTAKYMDLFDEMANDAFSDVKDRQIIDIVCSEINTEQTAKQKLVIVLHLIQLIAADGTITSRENELLYYISDNINIERSITDLIRNFVIYQERGNMTSGNILIIDNGDHDIPGSCKHINVDSLKGFIFILRIPDNDVFFGKYIGEETITMNGNVMRHNHIYVLSSGAVLKTDTKEPIFYSDIVSKFLSSDDIPRISFKAEKISFKFKNGHIGLRDITIAEEGGKLIAVMGGSGSGKSTLLNVLNGNERPSLGNVLINNLVLHDNKKEIEGVIGYIPQDDLLIEELTVFDNLFYAAKLCFKNKSDEEIKELVDKTIESLGLIEARDLKVGSPLEKSISGGQRKRVNIGLELLREPSILFVDEPTSGLSSRDSENIMELFKDLSLKGKMIFIVIHQPSEDIYKMFDKLILLDVGGYQIYYGNPVEAIQYFKRTVNMVGSSRSANPEQIFNIVESKVVNEYGNLTKRRKISPEQWFREFKSKIKIPGIKISEQKPEKTLHIPNRFKQFLIFCQRDIFSKLSNKQYLFINSLEAPFLALLLAFIIRYTSNEADAYSFNENLNIPVYFFMSVIVALFMGLTVSAEEIIKDRKILKREAFLNLSKFSYLSSKTVILFFISGVQTFTFAVIGNWILDIQGMTLYTWIVLFSVSCFANMLGLNISAALKKAITVYILIPLLIIPQLILSGVVVSFDKLNPAITNKKNVPIIGDAMATRWAYEALSVYQFKDNKYERLFYENDKVIAQSEYKNVYHLSKLLSHLEDVNHHYKTNNVDKSDLESKLLTMRNEFEKELFYIGREKFPQIDLLYFDKFNDDVYNETALFIEKLKAYYNLKAKKMSEEKENKISEFINSPNGKEELIVLKDQYQNEGVSLFVKNLNSELRIIEYKNEFIQKLYPIFNDPEFPDHPLDYRSHFFSPSKHFVGTWFDTVYFNVAVIWLMNLLLWLALYFDLLKKLLNGFSRHK